MSTIRVIGGRFKHKPIPFLLKKFNNADVTSQKVKGAVFSMLGEDLQGKSFLDLFSCSGQVGIEALSRGASPVIFNEMDKNRFSFIEGLTHKFNTKDDSILLNFHYERCLRYLNKNNFLLDIIFIDPPYFKERGNALLYNNILYHISKSGILADGGLLILQHFSSNILDHEITGYGLNVSKKYGNTSISIYSKL